MFHVERPGEAWWSSALGTREWILTAAVIVVPLIVAIVVTGWSLEQVRYRPKRRRPVKETVAGDLPGVGQEHGSNRQHE